MREQQMMAQALLEAIEQRRMVGWIRYMRGPMAAPFRVGRFAIVAGRVGSAVSAGMVAV